MSDKILITVATIFGTVAVTLLVIGLIVLSEGCTTRIKSTNPPMPNIVGEEMALGGPTALGIVRWSDEECKAIHKKTIAYTAVTATMAVLSGSTGIATAVLDEKTARWVTGGVSIGSAIVSAVFGTLLKFADDDFATGCRVATEPTTEQ